MLLQAYEELSPGDPVLALLKDEGINQSLVNLVATQREMCYRAVPLRGVAEESDEALLRRIKPQLIRIAMLDELLGFLKHIAPRKG